MTEPSGITKRGMGATTKRPGGSLARPHPRPRQEASWLPGGSTRHPLRLYLALGVETPKIDLFSANSPLYRLRRRLRIGAAWRSCPGTLPGGGTPSGRPSIAMDASRMCREESPFDYCFVTSRYVLYSSPLCAFTFETCLT